MTQKHSNPWALAVFREKIRNVVFHIGASKKGVVGRREGLKRRDATSSRFSRVSIKDQPLVFLPKDVKSVMKGRQSFANQGLMTFFRKCG